MKSVLLIVIASIQNYYDKIIYNSANFIIYNSIDYLSHTAPYLVQMTIIYDHNWYPLSESHLVSSGYPEHQKHHIIAPTDGVILPHLLLIPAAVVD